MKERHKRHKKKERVNLSENTHHIQQLRDKKRLPRGFDLEAESNKIRLPVSVHNRLHYIIDSSIYRNDLTTRVYFANMAYSGDLQDVPDRMYRTNPTTKK